MAQRANAFFLACIAMLAFCAQISFAENSTALQSAQVAQNEWQPSGASLSKLISAGFGGKPYTIPYEFGENGAHYYFIQFSGGQAAWAKLWQESGQTVGQFVQEKSEAQPLVAKYNLQRGIKSQIQPLIASASTRLNGITNGFESSQKDCRRMMGIAKQPCNSFESCKKACFSIPSFCGQIALGVGEKFIYGLWEYENDTLAVFALENETHFLAAAAEKNPYPNNILNFANSIGKLDEASRRITSTNTLIRETYCPAPPIKVSEIAKAHLEAVQAFTYANELSSEGATADALASSGLAANGNSTLPIILTPKIEVAAPAEAQQGGVQPSTANAMQFDIGAILPAAAALFGFMAAAATAAIILLRGKGSGHKGL